MVVAVTVVRVVGLVVMVCGVSCGVCMPLVWCGVLTQHAFSLLHQEARLLCMACQKARLDVVQWMCENSDDPQQLMNKQESWRLCRPMDFACMGGSVAVCELLESHGARVVIPEFELDLEVNGDETR